jgi:hypothetical protein
MKNEIKEILEKIKNSETIFNGEYYVIHSDYIIELEKELNINIKNEIKIDSKRVYEELKKLGEINKR